MEMNFLNIDMTYICWAQSRYPGIDDSMLGHISSLISCFTTYICDLGTADPQIYKVKRRPMTRARDIWPYGAEYYEFEYEFE